MFEPYTLRQRRLNRPDRPTLYSYESLPGPFRVQVAHIFDGMVGEQRNLYGTTMATRRSGDPSKAQVWGLIHDAVARHVGKFNLSERTQDNQIGFYHYLQAMSTSTGALLDAIELGFDALRHSPVGGIRYTELYSRRLTIDSGAAELNMRFAQHDLGYKLVGEHIIRIDSEYLHTEVVEPALTLLHDAGFETSTEAFLDAHRHYRHHEYRDAIADANNAFEGVMKAICNAEGWPYPFNATATPLIDTLIRNGLLPKEQESHYKGLISAMKSGLPTTANPHRHGPSPTPVEIPGYLAAHCLHLAAANIVFLVEARKARPH